MTTVINNPGGESSDSATSLIVGIIVLVIVAALFFIFVLPVIRNSGTPNGNNTLDVNVKLPASGNSNTSGSGN